MLLLTSVMHISNFPGTKENCSSKMSFTKENNLSKHGSISSLIWTLTNAPSRISIYPIWILTIAQNSPSLIHNHLLLRFKSSIRLIGSIKSLIEVKFSLMSRMISMSQLVTDTLKCILLDSLLAPVQRERSEIPSVAWLRKRKKLFLMSGINQLFSTTAGRPYVLRRLSFLQSQEWLIADLLSKAQQRRIL